MTYVNSGPTITFMAEETIGTHDGEKIILTHEFGEQHMWRIWGGPNGFTDHGGGTATSEADGRMQALEKMQREDWLFNR